MGICGDPLRGRVRAARSPVVIRQEHTPNGCALASSLVFPSPDLIMELSEELVIDLASVFLGI